MESGRSTVIRKKKQRTESPDQFLCTVRVLPTEACSGLSKVQSRRRTTGFSRRRALVASADGSWTIRVSSVGEMGGDERLRCEGKVGSSARKNERVAVKELETRRRRRG